MTLKSYTFVVLLALLQAARTLPNSNGIDFESFFENHEFDSQERIVGGAAVSEAESIPYQVSMQYLTKDGKRHHFCGGSILSPSRILTAAHCVNGADPKKMSVLAGVRDLNDEAGQRAQVVSFEMHENYEELVTSDIAILTVEPPLVLDGEKVDKIDVSGTQAVDGGQEVTLTGWGALWHFGTGPFASYPTRLQKMSYKTITNDVCKRTMSQLTETEICALERFGKGACNGDSGGPLVMRRNGEALKQVGVVSYGTALCASNSPDVYTRVSMFDAWIQARMA